MRNSTSLLDLCMEYSQRLNTNTKKIERINVRKYRIDSTTLKYVKIKRKNTTLQNQYIIGYAQILKSQFKNK